jgi:hypothetical protein
MERIEGWIKSYVCYWGFKAIAFACYGIWYGYGIVPYSTLWWGMVQYAMVWYQCGTVCYGTVWSMVWHDMVWSMVWYNMVWSMVWYGQWYCMEWCGMVNGMVLSVVWYGQCYSMLFYAMLCYWYCTLCRLVWYGMLYGIPGQYWTLMNACLKRGERWNVPKARFIRRISAVSNAIQTIDN